MQKRILLAIIVLAVLGASGLAVGWLTGSSDPAPDRGLERALEGLDALAGQFPPPGDEALEWPRDHATRPDQFAESWLFAGQLRDTDGRSYGFQLGFDRIAVKQDAAKRESEWAARDIYRGRFSVEPAGAPVLSEERVSRAALGLAGAEAEAPAVWLEDWSFSVDHAGGVFLLSGSTAGAGLSLQLTMPAGKPALIDAELYRGYWWPGLRVEGIVEVDGRSRPVTGSAMLDRLWGQGLPAGRGQLSLARLWLELSDGQALRCRQLRRRAGGGTPLTECIGHPAPVAADPALDPDEDGWETMGRAAYPLRWTLRLSASGQLLRLAPLAGERDPWLGGGWSGIVVMDEGAHWGLLELSNFGAP